MQGDSQPVGSSQGEASRSGTPRPQLGGAGDRTSNLQVTRRPALPPEPHAAQVLCLVRLWSLKHGGVNCNYSIPPKDQVSVI